MEEEKRVCKHCGKNISHLISIAKFCSKYCCTKYHRINNLDRYHTNARNRYHKDIEKSRKYNRDWASKNSERENARHKRWRENNPDKFKACLKKWADVHRDSRLANNRRRLSIDRVNLAESYIKAKIIESTFHDIEITPEMIETKRQIILLKRQHKL